MSRGYGAVREYHDDPEQGAPQRYRDNPFGDQSSRGYQSRGSSSAEELCDQIRNNIFQINNGANSIDRALKSIGTSRDTPQIRDRIHETSTNTNSVVKATTRLIRSANALKGDRQQKMQIDRLTSDFQEAISRFQTLQKKASEKVKSTVVLGSQKSKAPQPLVDIAGFGEAGDQQQLLEEDRVAELQAQEAVIQDDLTLIREREERIHQLESDILDVNEIFRDLGAMISEQGEMLNDIESNVERAHGNVEQGNEQLVKAANYQKKSRKKMCCLLLLFLIITVIVTIIIVVSVKTS
ncbi:syntaxin-7-like [Babylonia areolata]|uniref:syntaxin-7-like n=1 Tax=Babylonia areolata TaxID=304850 RepID=UPI003FCEE709